MREARIIIGTLMGLTCHALTCGEAPSRGNLHSHTKVGDEECMMRYTHAARYETVIFERGCRRCSQRKGPLPFKDAWENGWCPYSHAHPSTLAPSHLAALRVRTVW